MTLPERTPWQTANRWGPVVLETCSKLDLVAVLSDEY